MCTLLIHSNYDYIWSLPLCVLAKAIDILYLCIWANIVIFKGISIVEDSGDSKQDLKVSEGIQYAYDPVGETTDLQNKEV